MHDIVKLEVIITVKAYEKLFLIYSFIENLLIHSQQSRLLKKIEAFVENSNKSHGNGIIHPENFSPFPKNPTIAKSFKEIGWVDELGSGVRNIYKYNKIYFIIDGTPCYIGNSIDVRDYVEEKQLEKWYLSY